MNERPVGLLWDSVSNNTGDKAIGLVVQAFCKSRGIEFEIVNPFLYEPNRYSTIIVGGGELLRKLGDPFYDCFRVEGNHILNATGLYAPDNIDYLRNYSLVTVRSNAEKRLLQSSVPNASVRPCVSTLLGDYYSRPSTFRNMHKRSKKPILGVHLHYGTIEAVPDFLNGLQEINRDYHIVFVPFTLYNNDYMIMQRLAKLLPDASISEAVEPVDIFYEISSFDFMISSSLHASIFAFVQNVPVLAFPYLPKVSQFLEDRGLGNWVFGDAPEMIKKVTSSEFSNLDYSKLIEADKQKVREHLDEIASIVKQRSLSKSETKSCLPKVDHSVQGITYHKMLMQFLGQVGELRAKLLELAEQIRALTAQAAEKEQSVLALTAQVKNKESLLNEIVNSKAWKIALFFRRIRVMLVPPNSRRARVLRQGLNVIFFPFRKIRISQNLSLIRSSGLFDKDWYLSNNADIAQAKIDPLFHYLYNGGFEGRDPGPQFSSSWYLNTYADVKKSRINPLVHYLRYGRKEGRLVQAPVELTGGRPLKVAPSSHRLQFWSALRWISPKEIMRKILVKTNIWLSGRPMLRNLIKPLLSSNMRDRLNRAVQFNELTVNYSTTAGLSETLTDWDDYLQLTERISSANQMSLASFVPKKPSMVTLGEKNLIHAAKSIKLVPQENPQVSIIIPIHNNARLTLECLISIKQSTDDIDYEIICVDDGSDVETTEILRAIPHISLIHNNERIGFTRSCNLGSNAARGKYFLFLNNDTQVLPGWLKALVDVFATQDRVGAVGPKVLFPDGHLQEAGCLIKRDGTASFIGLWDNPDLPRYNFIREVDYCSGVSLMVNADVFREIGGFDDLYSPAYYEDVDLCLKLRARGFKMFYCPDAAIIHHLSATANKIDSSFKLQLIARNRQKFLERWQETLDDLNRVKLIAFYLPQYHPVPENDLWWGKGFTEWANVTRARPNYEGHYQPHLPADLGFYDLRLSEIMEQQVEMAKRYDIYGFCYYYYWFSGKRILEMPLERMLETGKPDFPFCLCWANENWSRRWDGSEDDILLAQNHSDQDDRAVILDLIRFLRHPNYIRIDGKPIILIYRVGIFPDIKRTAEIWREVCREENLGEIHLVMVESLELSLQRSDPHKYGFDATLEFPPHNMATPGYASGAIINPDFSGGIFNYRDEALKYVGRALPGHTHYNNVMPSWDSTARKQNRSFIFDQSTPGYYQAWLEAALQRTHEQLAGDQRILFINAWNEWAEGNHLEPDQRHGHRYLEATRNAQERFLLKPGS